MQLGVGWASRVTTQRAATISGRPGDEGVPAFTGVGCKFRGGSVVNELPRNDTAGHPALLSRDPPALPRSTMSYAPPYRFLHWLIQRRRVLLCVGIALAAGGALVGRQLQLDRSIEHMFAADDPILLPYRKLQQTFGRHDIVLAVYSEPQLTSAEGIQRIEELARRVRDISGVVDERQRSQDMRPSLRFPRGWFDVCRLGPLGM